MSEINKISAKENKAMMTDSRRIEPLLNNFLMLKLEIISSFFFKDFLIGKTNIIMELYTHHRYSFAILSLFIENLIKHF